jgi:Vitamin K-dependent gamma-carboxylase
MNRSDAKLPESMESWRQRLTRFLFPEQSDAWLTILRIGLGLQVFFYTLSLERDWNYLLGGGARGLNGRALAEGLLSTETPFVPRLGWLVAVGERVTLSESVVISLVWWLLLLTGVGLLVGFFSRSCAILSWFLHLCAAKSGGLVSYGMDNFMTIGLFYLMLSPLPDRYSVDQQLRKFRPKDGQVIGFFRRVLQVHLCLIYFFGGLTKALGSGWWDGSNLWRALIRPPFNVIAPEILVKWKYLFPVAGIFICILETGYAFFIWGKRTRIIWLIAICGMHVAIGLTMGMYLFASVMIILNVAAFGPGLVWAQPRAVSLTTPDQTA